MSNNGLSSELRWLALSVGAALIVGISFKSVELWLILTLFGYIFWLLKQNAVLQRWVEQTRQGNAPADDFSGTWGEIADDVRLLRKRYEKDKLRLQAVVTRVQEMTSALTDSVVLADSRGNIEWWNRSAELLFDFHDVDRGHRLVNIIRHPRFVTYFESNEYVQPLELEDLRHEEQHLEFHVHPFGQGERLVVVRDITRVVRLEQMRKDFVSNVSHELRTPLTVIKGYIETLIDAPGLSPPFARALDQMCQQSNRMNALINDLITLARLETEETEIQPKAVALAPLVKSIISDAEALSTEGKHRFSLTGDTTLALLGNEQELRSAISNLVVNAVKYSPNGGAITVELVNDPNGCIISIHDQGLGIESRHIPRITERFYRVDEGRSTNMGGTGLGLAIVKHVLMRHDAELHIRSRVGRGSTFSCHFSEARTLMHRAA